jgi:hypothetical protein
MLIGVGGNEGSPRSVSVSGQFCTKAGSGGSAVPGSSKLGKARTMLQVGERGWELDGQGPNGKAVRLAVTASAVLGGGDRGIDECHLDGRLRSSDPGK